MRLRPLSPRGLETLRRVGRHVEYRDLVWIAVTGTRFLVAFAVVVVVLVVLEEVDERRKAPAIPRGRLVEAAPVVPEDDDNGDFAD